MASYDEYYDQLHFLKAHCLIWKHCIPRSINPLNELKSLFSLAILLLKLRPAYIFSFTIKANIYSGIINFFIKSNHHPTITGIGRYFIQPLYKLSLKKSKKIIFQNYSDAALFKRAKITSEDKTIIVPGSGVNPNQFKPTRQTTFPKIFLFVSRFPLEKGLKHITAACQLLKESHPDWSLDFFGFPSESYSNLPKNMKYKGFRQSMDQIYSQYDCFIYCSAYREGLPKVTLEALATGTPLLLAGHSPDSRIIKPGYNGFKKHSLDPRDIHHLMIKWIQYPEAKKLTMRANARKLALKKFSENMVAYQYLNIIRV